MREGPYLQQVIRELLERLLLDEISRHVPDDERVGIGDGAYWIGHISSPYVDVTYELPTFERPLENGRQEITLAAHGGVFVTTTIRDIQSAGIWRNGEFEELAQLPPCEA
jgi:hypothetical protein